MINARLVEDKHAKPDLYSSIVDQLATVTADAVRLGELWSKATFLFPAGGDTTSTALSALLFYLLRNPVAYEKLCSEIRSAFTSEADIHSGSQISGFKYLRVCIDEALRMLPPVGSTLWREVASGDPNPGKSLVIDGHVVPPGTQVGVNIYALHHNEAYIPDAFSFRPER